MSFAKTIYRNAKGFVKSPFYRARFSFAKAYDSATRVNDNVALFEAFNGKSFGGNPFYVLLAMEEDERFRRVKKYVAVGRDAIANTQILLDRHKVQNCELVQIHSRKYCRLLATAKYLINNSTFPSYFIKSEGQIYLNTWHGTPLKNMGKHIADGPHTIGNTQRNFAMADYLLYPNEYTYEHFLEDYMFGDYITGEHILAGYPCNTALLDEKGRRVLRERLGLTDKRVMVYMPTWRSGSRKHPDAPSIMQRYNLMQMDSMLAEDIVMLAKPHYYDSDAPIDFSEFERIIPFPRGYETYEVLNIADVLITDYSSVMFDFLNAGKEIVLFTYDEAEYERTRGAYISLDELPFNRLTDVFSLCEYLNEIDISSFDTGKYSEAVNAFCKYDGPNAAAEMCDVLLGRMPSRARRQQTQPGKEGKERCLLYCGGLGKNGITTALLGLLDELDASDRDYLLFFYSGKGRRARDIIEYVSQKYDYYVLQGKTNMTYLEAISRVLYYRFDVQWRWVEEKLERYFEREVQRVFPDFPQFDSLVHFTGYERNLANLFLRMDSDNKIVFVHNDMAQEYEVKRNFHLPTFKRVYREFDQVAVVRDGLKPVMIDSFNIEPSKVSVVHNLNRIEFIRAQGVQPVVFDENTESTIGARDLQALLENDTVEKFINVARFSPEKGIPRLISAFEKYQEVNQNSALIIVGGYGAEYEVVLETALASTANIIVIRQVSNPLAIVSRCDLFILSSLYEGLPMSIMEALILGVPVVSTAISGPKEFLEQGYGYLVPNSEEGILQGLIAFHKGSFSKLQEFDCETFNCQALREFVQLLNR